MSDESFVRSIGRTQLSLHRHCPSPGHWVIMAVGELDLQTAADLRAEVSAVLAERPLPIEVELNLSGVTFVDSLGLGTLVVGYRICAELGVRFVVRNASPFVSRLLEVSGFRDQLAGV
ncbi:MAG TPA: STAS domain-containing protein [Micromonosporaceae bacterium]